MAGFSVIWYSYKALESSTVSILERDKKKNFDSLLSFKSLGYNPLHAAASLEMPITLNKHLKEGKFKTFELDAHSQPPIYHAVHEDSTECLKILLDYYTKIDFATKQSGDSLLQLAITKGNKEAAKLLMDCVDINHVNYSHSNALHSAVENDMPYIAQLLLELGIDRNQQTKTVKLTPFHIAANNGDMRMLELLADIEKLHPWLRDSGGHTALDLAKKPQFHRKHNADAVYFLEEFYARAEEYLWNLTEHQKVLFDDEYIANIQCIGADIMV